MPIYCIYALGQRYCDGSALQLANCDTFSLMCTCMHIAYLHTEDLISGKYLGGVHHLQWCPLVQQSRS